MSLGMDLARRHHDYVERDLAHTVDLVMEMTKGAEMHQSVILAASASIQPGIVVYKTALEATLGVDRLSDLELCLFIYLALSKFPGALGEAHARVKELAEKNQS